MSLELKFTNTYVSNREEEDMPHELSWIPILTLSLAISLGGLGAYIERTWRSEKEPTSYKIAFTALAGTIILLIVWIIWYLNKRILEVLF
jgi:hypothetical protein